jgi:hypothetical protein
MRGNFSIVVVGVLALLLTSAVPVAGRQTRPDQSVPGAPCTVEYTISPAVAAVGVNVFLERIEDWSWQLHRIYQRHGFDTWLQGLRLARTMAKADSRFVEWMDANPATACYQPVQSKMRTRTVAHAAIMRGYARLVMDQRFDEANAAWRLGADHHRNTFRWLNRTSACGRSFDFD